MAQSPKKHLQIDYLESLLANHRSSVSLISNFLTQKQSEYEQKIKQGQYDIRKASFSLGNNAHIDQKSIDKYRKNREQLSSQLHTLSKSIEKPHVTVTDQERKKFVKQMIVEQKKINLQRQEKRRAEELRMTQQQEQRKRAEEAAANERLQNKRKQIERRLSQLSQEKQRREEEMKYRNREYKHVASEKILLHRMVESYNKLQNTTLEEKKKKLAAIRQIHKPMSKQEFDQHLSRINQYKEQKEQEKEMMQMSKVTDSNVQFYKSKWHKEVLKEEKVDENKLAEEEKQALKQLKDRQKKYAEYIRHNFAPQSDDKLVEELAKRQPEPIVRKKAKEIRQMGLNNLQYSKQKIVSKEELEEKVKEKLKTSEPIQPKTKNYLEQIKTKRRNSSLNDLLSQKSSKKGVLPDQVRNFAEHLQNRAKKQEELRKLGKQVSEEQLDSLYIKALQAKLNLLNNQKE